jgi:subtilisin family serine protease
MNPKKPDIPHAVIFAGIALALFAAPIAGVQTAEAQNIDAANGEIVIGLKEESSSSGRDGWSSGKTVNLLSLLGDDEKILHKMTAVDGIVISATDVDRTLARLNADSRVFAAELNHHYFTYATPTDPKLPEMWFLKAISAYQAWDVRSTSPGIVVAVIDNGIQLDHDDLKSRIWTNVKEIPGNGIDDDKNGYIDDINGWNFYGGNNLSTAAYVPLRQRKAECVAHPTEKIYETHGTHVAGTIGAVAGNKIGVVGISHDVRIMALKALGGPCGGGRLSGLVEAIAYATAHGAKVINLSLGGPHASKLIRREIEKAISAGVSVVAAAGNEANDNDKSPRYPAGYPVDGLISVAATGPNDELASFSNFGERSVDVAAPGVEILNTIPTGKDPARARSGYGKKSGTSMATPIVAGAIALVRAQNPDLSPAEIERRIQSAVDPVTRLKPVVRAGGRLNLAKLLGIAGKPVESASPKPPPLSEKKTRRQSLGGIRLDGGVTPQSQHSPKRSKAKSGEITGKSLY